MWRFALAAVVMIVLVGALIGLVAAVVGRALDGPLVLVITIVVIILAMGVAVRFGRRTGAGLADLVEAAAQIEAGDYAVRVTERGPRGSRGLARAFNAMSAHLEQTDDARRRLLADVSHELRTPLTVMQGTLEGMLDGVYPADAAHLAPVLEETRVLARLVEDLRTLSLSEAGSLLLHPEPTDLGLLLGEVVASHQVGAQAAGVSLALEAAELPTLDVDPARIRQILTNLVANALRSTPSGGRATVDVSSAGDFVTISVTDTGVGMEPDEVEHAFDRFYRSANSSGSGLGLPIARNLVEAHGGTITLESRPAAGTTVRFSLPIASAYDGRR